MSIDGELERDSTFTGFQRPDGRLGVRNHVLALPSVICSHLVAEEIAARSDRTVAAPHDHGCGQLGADNQQTAAVLEGVATNPNVAGTVVVGLGCEEVQSGTVASRISDRELPVRHVAIQDAGGTDECIEEGVTAAGELAARADAATAGRGTLGELTVGIVGDLADSSVEQAHPLVSSMVERVVASGGRIVVAGSERFAAHPEETRRRSTAAARDDVDAFLRRHASQPARAKRVAARAVEKGPDASLGHLGEGRLDAVIDYGRRPPEDADITLVDAPSRFEEAATALAAAGAHIVVHVTADGVPAGHPIVPVVKVSGNAGTVAALPNDIDVDATAASPTELTNQLLSTAGGTPVCAEHHGLVEFAITRIGPSM